MGKPYQTCLTIPLKYSSGVGVSRFRVASGAFMGLGGSLTTGRWLPSLDWNMKSDGPLKHFILAFVLAVICYAFFYTKIENRRTRKGPWTVMFTNSVEGWPQLVIDQPKLSITNIEINFPDQSAKSTQKHGTLVFNQARPV